MWNTRPYTLDSARFALLDTSPGIFVVNVVLRFSLFQCTRMFVVSGVCVALVVPSGMACHCVSTHYCCPQSNNADKLTTVGNILLREFLATALFS